MHLLRLRDYYKCKEFLKEASAIQDLSWRHIRLVLKNGHFLKIDRQVTCKEDLKSILVRYSPLDAYYSTSCFLDPTKLRARSADTRYQALFLYNDIVFDIDCSPISLHNIDKARKEALKVLSFMAGHQLKYIAFSGSKGFHLVYKDNQKSPLADPYERELAAISRRKELVTRIKEKNIKIDAPITIDTRRILRIPGTINSKTGLACTLMTAEELSRSTGELMARVQKVSDIRIPRFNLIGYLPKVEWPAILRLGAEDPAKGDKSKRRSDFEHRYCTYLSNSVMGVKNRYVPFIRLDIKDEKSALKSFTEIATNHDLPGFLVFRQDEGFTGVCLATFQKKELIRLMRKTASTNLPFFLKYRHCILELNKSIGPQEENPLISPISIIKREMTKKRYASKGHHHFFSKLTHLEDPPLMHGTENVKLTYTSEYI